MSGRTYFEQLDACEREILKVAIEQANGDTARAARSLRLSQVALELKLERLQIAPRQRRVPVPRGDW